jgi:hypothetical protein
MYGSCFKGGMRLDNPSDAKLGKVYGGQDDVVAVDFIQ